jgi:hypothetical protein
MGILTDVFIASEADLASLRPGQGGPAAAFPTVQGKGIDPLKLATLEAIVTGQAINTYLDAVEEPTRDWGEEFVNRFPEALVSALAQLRPGEIRQVAAAWAETEEWRLDGLTQEALTDLARLIDELCTLAQQALRENKLMYMWMSL